MLVSRAENRRLFRDRRRANLARVVPNEIILEELARFLEQRFRGGAGTSLLDLGAGTKPYAPMYSKYFERCVSVDVAYSPHDTTGIDVFAGAESLPFDDESFDCVLCTEVLEHCADPGRVMREIHRTLRMGGYAFVTTPFLTQLHELPHDYYRFTPSGLAHLAGEAGLEVVSITPRGDYFAVALGIIQHPLTKLIHKLSGVLKQNVYRYENPFVFIVVVLPQLLYLAYWRRSRTGRDTRMGRLYDKLSYFTTGYVTELRRPYRAQSGR